MAEAKHTMNKEVAFQDEGLDIKATAQYHLSLQIGMEGLAFCILDIQKHKYLALESYRFQGVYDVQRLKTEISKQVKQHPLLSKSFKTVHIAYVGTKTTLVPNPLFDPLKQKELIAVTHQVEEGETIIADKLKTMDARNVFLIPAVLQTLMKQLFPTAIVQHYSTALIDSLLAHYKNKAEKRVIVHVQYNHFDVIVLEEQQLLLFNSFRHQTSEDFIYYLLFVMEQLKLNPENAQLILYGEVEKSSAIYSILYKYVRNVSFGERNEAFKYSYKMDDIPEHFYYNLLSQYLCV